MKIPPYEPDRVFKRDELILAKWADCRLYFATVLSRIDESKRVLKDVLMKADYLLFKTASPLGLCWSKETKTPFFARKRKALEMYRTEKSGLTGPRF